MRRNLLMLVFYVGFPVLQLVAQTSYPNSYPFVVARDRMLFHDNVDKEQKKLLKDGSVRITRDESINLQIEDALIRRLDEYQEEIELDSTLSSNDKKKYLRGLEAMLRGFNQNWNKRDFSPSQAPALLSGYMKAVNLDRQRKSIQPVISENEWGVGKILVECFLLPSENIGVQPSRIELLGKYMSLHPEEILTVLNRNPDLPFVDSLIVVAAHNEPTRLYDFAQGGGRLAFRIRNHNDALVKAIARMANSKSGQMYFPFLDNIVNGKISFAEIDSVKNNDFAYYRLLVKTRLDYIEQQMTTKQPVWAMDAILDKMSHKAKEYFIREINALHVQENLNIRFKRLEGLTPQELYYLCVLCEDEIYTSSYVSGVYPRIFERMANPRADSLLISVHGDYFRKFIKMAAGYNTLNDFLGRMDKENANTLMKAFVIGLEKTKGLEDAVDVADSYSSIVDKNPELASFVLRETDWNLKKNLADNNKRGVVIYRILKSLFESTDTTKKVDLSATLGIPPVYNVSYSSLVDDTGRVVQQVFFYGDEDKDGQHSFVNFMGMFRGRPEWKISENAQWVSITSTKGKPVWIFANKPLLGPDDPDAKAQEKLHQYLEAKNLKPTVVIHRGHSYHLKYTLEQLAPTAKIVVLGSCGGYNNLNDVLTICQDAHIISSKQVGTKTVNEPILQAINANLNAGKNIDWINIWKELTTRFQHDAAAREKFDDYIPPYKNLGAIFIKAYKRAMGETLGNQ